MLGLVQVRRDDADLGQRRAAGRGVIAALRPCGRVGEAAPPVGAGAPRPRPSAPRPRAGAGAAGQPREQAAAEPAAERPIRSRKSASGCCQAGR